MPRSKTRKGRNTYRPKPTQPEGECSTITVLREYGVADDELEHGHEIVHRLQDLFGEENTDQLEWMFCDAIAGYAREMADEHAPAGDESEEWHETFQAVAHGMVVGAVALVLGQSNLIRLEKRKTELEQKRDNLPSRLHAV